MSTVKTHQGDALTITASVGALPSQIELFPTGTIRLADQRGAVGVVTNAQALADRSMSAAKGGMIPIDFGHGMDGLAGANPRAAGWITALSVVENRIMADVEWTTEGAEALEGKMFRFISPTFTVPKGQSEVGHILRAGLTNNPALPELSLVASQQEKSKMSFAQLAAKLGMPDETDEAKILAAAEGAIDQVDHLTPIIAAAGLSGALTAAGATAVVAKMADTSAAQPDPTKFVPLAVFSELQTQLASAQTQIGEDRTSAIVASAITAGKVTPAMKDWATSYAEKDLDGFKTWLASAPSFVAGAPLTPAGDPPAANDGKLTAEEVAICAATGISEEAFLATKTGMPVKDKKEA
jgi:phage I-like protein